MQNRVIFGRKFWASSYRLLYIEEMFLRETDVVRLLLLTVAAAAAAVLLQIFSFNLFRSFCKLHAFLEELRYHSPAS